MADLAADHREQIVVERTPVGTVGRKSSGWYGMMMLIVTEAALFVYLLFSYYYLALWSPADFLPEDMPSLRLAAPNTVLLLASSVAVWWGERGARQGRRGRMLVGIALAFVMGAAFAGIQLLEWLAKPFRYDSNVYGSLYFTITGLHMAHVAVGLAILLLLLVWALLGYFSPRRHAQVMIGAAYWHFVDAVWLSVFFTFYVTPYLGAS